MKTNRRSRFGRFNYSALIAVFVFAVAAAAVPLYSVNSGSNPVKESLVTRENRVLGPAASKSWFAPPAPLSLALLNDTVELFAADCTTVKTTFELGEPVCIKVTGGIAAPRRLVVIDPAGNARQVNAVSTDPETFTFTVPSDQTSTVGNSTIDNRGKWKINLISGRGSSVATFGVAVTDPDESAADVSIVKAGPGTVATGGNSTYLLWVYNSGPDAATNVTVTDALPSQTTFVGLAQSGDVTFTCTDPGAGNNGTVSCTLASMPAESRALIEIEVEVDESTPTGTVISNTATIASEIEDNNSTNDSASAVINVTAPAPPVACTLTCPADVVTTANTTQSGQPGRFITFSSAGVTGDCGSLTTNPSSGAFFTVGSHTVSVTSETGGGSCNFTVKVLDTPEPTITCPPNQTATAPSGSDEANVSVGTPTFTASGGGTVTGLRSDSTPPVVDSEGNVITPGIPKPLTDPYPVGVTGILWTVTDADGRTATCRQTVTVFDNDCGTDNQNPTITAPDDITVGTGPGNTSCTVAADDWLGEPEASDNCSFSVNISGIPAGNAFAPGTYTLTYTATDGAGNTASDTQVVTVVDNTAPAIEAPADASYVCMSEVPAANPNQATRGDVFDENGNLLPPGPPFDNCGSPTVTVTETSSGAGSAADPRIITRTFTATDSAGNTSSDTQTITVADGIAPTIALNQAGQNPQYVECHTSYTELGATASDNCSADFAATPSGTVDVNTPGTYTITYNANDAAGNPAASVTRTVIVQDTIAPTMSCPADIVVYLPLNSPATSMAVSFTAPTATDACDTSVPVTTTHASGSVFPVGTTTVTASATDDSGNPASCSFTITVLYNFTGFFAPVDNLPVLNTVNAGRAIPVKFSLSGNKGLDIFAANSPYTISINCDGSAPQSDVEETLTAGGSSLNYSPDTYIYVWKTESSWAGTCRQLVVKLNDGSEHRANFKFR